MDARNTDENKNAKQKLDALYKIWLGIRDDYRTLIGVEDSKIVKIYDVENEEDGDV